MIDESFTRQWNEIMEGENQKKLRRYHELNAMAVKGQTVLAGSSLMEFFPINEMLLSKGNHTIVYNRGMAGYTIDQYDAALPECVLELMPKKLFINIGSNDLNKPGDTIGNLILKYRKLLQRIQEALPECEITVLAYYPCRKAMPDDPIFSGNIVRTMENVNLANEKVQELAGELGCSFLNLNAPLMDENGYLRAEYAVDQIHFSPAGYAQILPLLEPLL